MSAMHGSICGERVSASLRFVSQRLLRGIPRLIAQIAICFVLLHILVTFTTSSHGGGYRNLWAWSSHRDATTLRSTEGLRIVVFGSQDVMGSAISDTESSRHSWTLQLCKELSCTSYMSLAASETMTAGVTSNDLYATALDEFQASLEGADLLKTPSADYEFLTTQYPTPSGTPDLAEQVQQFLSLAPQEPPSRSTIWIFTFGTWDVWNLAALPAVTATDVLDGMVEHIFEQAELLYLKALNPSSIAFSHFWTNMTQSDINQRLAAAPKHPDSDGGVETFLILIPELFDVTASPIWQTRQEPPYPHTRAEQLRNAVALTRRWNSQVQRKLVEWKVKARTKPAGIEAEGILSASSSSSGPASDVEIERFADALPAEATEQKTGEEEPLNLVYAPYPKRAGLQILSGAAAATEAMMAAEMARGGVSDALGNGARPASDAMYFTDAWAPCFASKMLFPEGQEEQQGGEAPCETPDDHLFHDAATLNQRAIDSIASKMASDVLHMLSGPGT